MRLLTHYEALLLCSIYHELKSLSHIPVLTRHVCKRRSAVHMDCMHWVNRDSYLPQGSRGLKVRTGACRLIHILERNGLCCQQTPGASQTHSLCLGGTQQQCKS